MLFLWEFIIIKNSVGSLGYFGELYVLCIENRFRTSVDYKPVTILTELGLKGSRSLESDFYILESTVCDKLFNKWNYRFLCLKCIDFGE